jgi:hypothetical protein
MLLKKSRRKASRKKWLDVVRKFGHPEIFCLGQHAPLSIAKTGSL